jgi:carnitine-CoA ligase
VTAFRAFLESQAGVYGDREALRIDGVARSFPQLHSSVTSLAAGMAELGVGSDDHVAIMMETSHEAVDAWLASAVLGCVDVPLNTKYRGDLLRYLIDDSEATVVICDAAHLKTLYEAGLSQTGVRTVIVHGDLESRAHHRLVDVYAPAGTVPHASAGSGAVVLYTSGTTGPSKGVMHTQESCLRLSEYTGRVCGYKPDDALLNFFPLYHQNARYTGIVMALAVGCRLQLDSKFSSSEFWTTCRRNGITAFNYLGSVLTMIMGASKDMSPEECRDHRVRRAYGAGAAPAVWEEFEQRFGVSLVEVYGLTEAPMVTANAPPRVSPLGSAGREGDLFELAILGDDDRRAPAGVVGEIAVRPKVPNAFMLGYYGRDGDTVRATRNLWFHTGDRGWLSPEGDLFFEERSKDSIRRRGENISAWEVESVLNKHPDVFESAVYGVQVEAFDEEVMAAIVPAISGADVAQIIRDSVRNLPSYAVPRYVRAVDELPRTDTMKVQKAELRRDGVTAETIDLAAAPAEIQ